MNITTELPGIARKIVVNLRANGFEPDDGEAQMLALMEEAGEVVGALRRCTGRARRTGTIEELQAELADMVITAHVTAITLGYELTTVPVRLMYGVEPADAWPYVMAIFRAVGYLSKHWARKGDIREELEGIARMVYGLSGVLRIDLDAAIEAKLEIVFSRGATCGSRRATTRD